MVPRQRLTIHLPRKQHIPSLPHSLADGDRGSIGSARLVCVVAVKVDVGNGGVTGLQACLLMVVVVR